MHLTGGILRHFQAFSTPEQNPAPKVLSRPAHPQVTQTVGRFVTQQNRERNNANGIYEYNFIWKNTPYKVHI